MVRGAPSIPAGPESANAEAAAGRSGADYINEYYISVKLVKDYLKWFGWREIARLRLRVNRVSY
jgi:hypothetical protein